jgi:hypothetical protein
MMHIVKEKLCLILKGSTFADRQLGCYNFNFGQIGQILSHGATHRR